jgi:hypothetical protein
MKKWLILFVIVDFIFVGLILKLSTENQRKIASSENAEYADFTDGQKRKYDLVQSLNFNMNEQSLTLSTNQLQLICDTSSLIELKFTALNVVYAGTYPTISHTFSCEKIKADLSQTELKTSLKDFIAMHKNKRLPSSGESEIKAFQVYADEDFPTEWQLSEMVIAGAANFTITLAELNKVHTDHRFEFNISTFVK